jgi:hypothetical protein
LKSKNQLLDETQEIFTDADIEKAAAAFSEFIGVLVFGIFCTYYAVVFKNYKNAVEKHQMLTDLFNNPNVRVASGESAS